MGTTPRNYYSNEPSEHQALLSKAQETKFDDEQSFLRFKLQVRKSREENEDEFKYLLHTLAGRRGKEFYDTNGPALLEFIVSHDEQYVLNLISEKTKRESMENPLHVAISKENHEFLESILSLAVQFDKVDQIAAALEQTDNRDYTCLHAAIAKKLPCVPAMVGVCARIAKKVFSMEGSGQNTPLHLLMDTDPYVSPVYDIETEKYITSDFKPRDVLKDMKTWLDTDMGPLWTKLNKDGLSPYLKRLNLKKKADEDEEHYQAYLKSQIFQFRLGISAIKKGLYGNGEEKELCLDMSDFNQSSHDFTMFVSEMVKLPEKGSPLKELLQFEESLIYVFLPDLNTFKKKIPHTGVRALFQWLSDKAHVKTIKSLNIPDSITTPMSDELVSEAIIDRFVIEKFDWRKLDINLDILTKSNDKDKFTDLTLYSSGNWSVLYHWISAHGLQELTGLQNVTIKIVEPNTSNKEREVQKRYDDLVEEYKEKLEDQFAKMKIKRAAGGLKFDGKVIPNQKWDFQAPQYITDSGDMKLEIIEKLKACHTFLESLKEKAELQAKVQEVKAEPNQEQILKYSKRFASLTEPPTKSGEEDRRIRVAIIDNGADKFRLLVKDAIEKGASFVKVDSDSESRILPWWMVSDPHGTQMASLIRDANPYCRLYIARAIDWAIDQNVDVISISWIIKEPFPALLNAVERAAKRSLVICSTADEGAWSGEVYPANWESMVKVAATDKYGNLSPKSDQCAVNIAVPGENIPAFGPSYMGAELAVSKISGSSVATALAAGVASLALLLLQVFNKVNRDKLREGGLFYTNKGMAQVLSRLKSSASMSTLFPTDLNELPDLWNVDKLKQWLEREVRDGNRR